MITSYVNPSQSLLYLSLVGPLNETGANDLVHEYYERHAPTLRQCLLDLSGSEAADGSGLNVLHRLALLAQVDQIEFAVIAQGSPAQKEIQKAAQQFWVDVVDGQKLPFVRKPV